jgi:hypothetical protein
MEEGGRRQRREEGKERGEGKEGTDKRRERREGKVERREKRGGKEEGGKGEEGRGAYPGIGLLGKSGDGSIIGGNKTRNSGFFQALRFGHRGRSKKILKKISNPRKI